MGFVWVQNIAVGASIDSVDATEIRTNIDTVDDEKCAADKVGVDAAYCPGYYSDQHTSYQNANLAGVDASYCPGYYNDQHISYAPPP